MWKYFFWHHVADGYFYTMILNSSTDLKIAPRRIISLVPSQTELLAFLGLQNETVGITKFCVHPFEWQMQKEKIGGTKNLNISKIKSLQPDFIIANKEENVKEQVEELAGEFPVWVTDVNDFAGALQMINDIGEFTKRQDKVEELIVEITNGFSKIQKQKKPLQTAYLIWKDPWMVAGGDTFIHDMLRCCGLQNIFSHTNRYFQITINDLQTLKCEVLFLSSEPYPFKQVHLDELQVHLPNTKIILVDGEMFSWYGSRLLLAPAYFNQLLSAIKNLGNYN